MLKTILLFLLRPLLVAGKAWWRFLDEMGVECSSGYRIREYKAPTRWFGKTWESIATILIYAPCYFFITIFNSDARLIDAIDRQRFHSYKADKRRMGFTLIELSIALVVVGLIFAGIMVSKDIVKAAQIRGLLGQIESIKTSALAFDLKYDCIPGDCPNATDFFPDTTQPEKVSNGNGDGRICDAPPYLGAAYSCNTADTNARLDWQILDSGVNYAEPGNFFDHLAAAQLFPLSQYDETTVASHMPDVGFPSMKFQSSGVQENTNGSGSWGGIVVSYMKEYQYMNEGHKISLGDCGTGTSYSTFFCGFNGLEGYMIDSKVDDGKPQTGKVKIQGLRYVYRIPGDLNDEVSGICTTTNTLDNAYRTSPDQAWENQYATWRRCNLAFDVDF